jgi:hypothetical protein
MGKLCKSADCCYANYCHNSGKCIIVTKETKKGIANSVAHILCNDWQIFSLSSMLESDGMRLEKIVQEKQKAEGCDPCFKAPY